MEVAFVGGWWTALTYGGLITTISDFSSTPKGGNVTTASGTPTLAIGLFNADQVGNGGMVPDIATPGSGYTKETGSGAAQGNVSQGLGWETKLGTGGTENASCTWNAAGANNGNIETGTLVFVDATAPPPNPISMVV